MAFVEASVVAVTVADGDHAAAEPEERLVARANSTYVFRERG